jgi:hypothetical protein
LKLASSDHIAIAYELKRHPLRGDERSIEAKRTSSLGGVRIKAALSIVNAYENKAPYSVQTSLMDRMGGYRDATA